MKKIKTKKGSAQPNGNGLDLLEIIKKAVELSLKKRGAYSWDISEELSAQLAFTLFNTMEVQDINEMSHYVRTCAKNLVINHLSKSKNRHEVATDPIDMPMFDTRMDITVLDNIIRDEYLSIHTRQLAFIRSVIGPRDYEMLEAHFRDDEQYKTIAERMELEVHIVANHINRARARCQKLKEEGHISY